MQMSWSWNTKKEIEVHSLIECCIIMFGFGIVIEHIIQERNGLILAFLCVIAVFLIRHFAKKEIEKQ
jgi:uncharacterized membrane protein YadS